MALVDELLLVDVGDRIAMVTLNRPDARNALNADLLEAIPRAMHELDADDAVDVIILTGADPAFCAGLDLKALAAGERLFVTPTDRRGPLPSMTKPVIGAVNGAAVTGGFELALACDFLVASDRARFADTHSRVGVMPGWGLTVLLPQAIGVRRAREMSITGNYITAEQAYDWGLVNHVVPHQGLLPFCRKLAEDICSNDQPGVRQMLRTYHETTSTTVAEAHQIEAQRSREWAEGISSEEIGRRREAIVDRGRSQL